MALVALQDLSFWNLSDIEFDLSRSLKVKCDSFIGLPIYAFLLLFNSKVTEGVKFDDVIGLSIHGFLFITVITRLTPTAYVS